MFEPIDIKEFEERTGNDCHGLGSGLSAVRQVIALRDIVRVDALLAMPQAYLERLIYNIGLVGQPSVHPYRDLKVECLRLDPRGLHVGQTFVQRSKYQNLLEDFSGVFSGFTVVRGIAKRTATIVIGRDAGDQCCLAHYVPPIVEANGQRERLFLLDGIHRNFLVMQIGTTVESVVIRGVETPLPCDTRGWESVRPVDEKPPKGERFFNLRPEYFRDVKHIGIDG